MTELEQEETHMYLGGGEGDGINHNQMKGKFKKEYYRRVRLILSFDLNSQNRVSVSCHVQI